MEEDGWAFGHAELEFKRGSSSYARRLGYRCVLYLDLSVVMMGSKILRKSGRE